MLDDDLHFAAALTASKRGRLRDMRRAAVGAMRELSRRWQCVGGRLRAFQPEGVRQATAQRDVGLLGLLVVLLAWPDVTMPSGFVTGLPAVGFAHNYGVFPQQEASRVSFADVLGNWEEYNCEIGGSLRPGKDDEFLLTQSCKDADNGYATQPMTWNELQRCMRGQPFRLIPRCVITQCPPGPHTGNSSQVVRIAEFPRAWHVWPGLAPEDCTPLS